MSTKVGGLVLLPGFRMSTDATAFGSASMCISAFRDGAEGLLVRFIRVLLPTALVFLPVS